VRAVCSGDRWLGPDCGRWIVVALRGSEACMRLDTGHPDAPTMYVPHKVLEHEDTWRWLGGSEPEPCRACEPEFYRDIFSAHHTCERGAR